MKLQLAPLIVLSTLGLSACVDEETILDQETISDQKPMPDQRSWLAGDHHIHSLHSTSWDTSIDPPVPETAADVRHSITMKALMAKHHGLKWMVSTDHGGREHARISVEQAYPDLLRSRQVHPDLFQFFGIELNTPGGDHNTVIMPQSEDEAARVYDLESTYDRTRFGHIVPEWNDNSLMLSYLREANAQSPKPIVIANHVSRRVSEEAPHVEVSASEFRSWNDEAPEVSVGMEGLPGHQAAVFKDSELTRGLYSKKPTFGGYDAATAEIGNFWDSMLGEGRRWWITASSDSHKHWTEGGVDFWPGEYAKTYVYAEESYEDILSGLRSGRVFTVAGDLISELYVEAATSSMTANIGGTLEVESGGTVTISIRATDPRGENHHGDSPEVARIDVILGEIRGPNLDVNLATHSSASLASPSAQVIRRFTEQDWQRDGEVIRVSIALDDFSTDSYIRVRGTSSAELEPLADVVGEDPWQDLWFYSNPVYLFIK